jgi:hypothetical protein
MLCATVVFPDADPPQIPMRYDFFMFRPVWSYQGGLYGIMVGYIRINYISDISTFASIIYF